MRLILLVIFTVAALNAQYLRTIRIGSYPTEKTAKKALVELNTFVASKPDIEKLQKQSDFQFKMRPSGKYYITLAEPFTDRKTLQKVLDILREAYSDVYVTRLKNYHKRLKTAEKKKIIVPKILKKAETVTKKRLDSIKNISSAPKNVMRTLDKNITIQTVIEENRTKRKINQKNIVPIVTPAPAVRATATWDIWKILAFVLFMLVIVILFFLLKLKKKNGYYKEQQLFCEEKIEKAQIDIKNKEKLLAHVSHELRSPMTSILGLTRLVLESDLPKLQKDYVQKIEDSSKHLLHLINDILDISKIQAGELKIEKSEFNINDIVNFVFNTISIQAKHNNISIDVHVSNDVPSLVIGDSLRLGQILINLLSNSVKFTKDGEVSLSVKKLESFADNVTLEFKVSDTGIGMTSSQLQGLFKSFYQADDSISREYGGTGLGLAISKQLVELMGGKIQVQSKKGVGTTFTFTVVLALRDSQNKRQYRLPSASLLNKKVLLVDYYNKNAIPLAQAFGYFKYKTHNMESFKNANISDYSDFDIIVINLHNLTKLAIEQLQMIKKKYKTKIVVLSELHSSLNNALLDQLEIDAYLKPPITIQNILDLITELYIKKNIVQGIKKLNPKDKLKALGPKKVLVAEDNELNHKVIAGLLAQTPIELTFVTDGQQVLDLLERGIVFDLIFMDINMPILNGYETTVKIRQNSKYDSIPILALSADETEDAVKKSLASGMQGHVVKPISYESFYTTLFEYLSKKKIHIEKNQPQNIENGEKESSLSISSGLAQCNNDAAFYKNILEDFKKMYKNSAKELQSYCEEDKFKEARHLAMDIKDIAFNIGAYQLAETAANMEYEFEKGSRSNWREHLQGYEEVFTTLLEEINKYLRIN